MSAADDVPLGVALFENQGVKGSPLSAILKP
jgi:hypothetical protein